jgi:hypothetical protein
VSEPKELWGEDLRDAVIRDCDMTGARITHSMVRDVEIDGIVRRLVVNGVDVTDYVNERDEWFAIRSKLFPTTKADMAAGLAALEAAWLVTIGVARSLPDAALHEQVDGEFSFVETLRHVVFAIDKWFTAPVLGEPFDPMGLPNRGSLEFPFPGLDLAAAPSADDALGRRADRMTKVQQFVDGLTDADDLDRPFDILENGPGHALHDCIGVVMEEAFWHLRYARRDLAALSRSAGGAPPRPAG